MSTTSFKTELLDLIRCPVAVKENNGDDPGRLELVKDEWLVCRENGHKYPIVDGIPVLLPEEGQHWSVVPEEELPIPAFRATKDD